MPAVRQKRGEGVICVLALRVEEGDRGGGAARGCHLEQAGGKSPEDDSAIARPQASYEDARQTAKRLGRPAGRVNFLQRSLHIERDEAAVGRPELQPDNSFRARKGTRLELV